MRLKLLWISLALLLPACAARERTPSYESAHRSVRPGMSRQEAESILSPHAQTSALVFPGSRGFGPLREYFALSGGLQTWIDLRDDVVVHVGPIEPRTKWFHQE